MTRFHTPSARAEGSGRSRVGTVRTGRSGVMLRNWWNVVTGRRRANRRAWERWNVERALRLADLRRLEDDGDRF